MEPSERVCMDCGASFPLTPEFFPTYTQRSRRGERYGGFQKRCRACRSRADEAKRERYRAAYAERGGPAVAEFRCVRCKVTKPVAEFYPNPGTATGIDHQCKPCKIIHVRETAERTGWRLSEKTKRVKRSNTLKRLYGINMDEFDAMVEAQSGECALCGCTMTRPAVDHDHATGRVRELLCGTCNAAIGMLNDDPELMRKAAAYVERHRAALPNT